MVVVDASCLCAVVIGGPGAEGIRNRLSADNDHAAPHIIDVEVFGVIRREYQRGHLDRTEATQAVEDLEAWPGERFGHRLLLARAWHLRDTVRGWDAMHVALAEERYIHGVPSAHGVPQVPRSGEQESVPEAFARPGLEVLDCLGGLGAV